MTIDTLYQYLLYFLFGFSAITFISSFFYTTPYGRHKEKKALVEFPPLPGWILLESPCLFAAALTFFFSGGNTEALVPLIFICIWQSHYFYRSLLFPILVVNKNSKPVALSGIGFGIFFNSLNGFLNGYAFSHAEHLFDNSWLTTPYFIAGILLMIVGVSINIQSDRILKKLRGPGETGYKIPQGGLYRFVSVPNYFGEIIEWLGLAIAACTPAALAFLLFTIANLFPRALAHHKWYKEKFADYPKERKAIIPFIL
jgi:protein-S-isoprenylcysteine O-methyltransferase Ste14